MSFPCLRVVYYTFLLCGLVDKVLVPCVWAIDCYTIVRIDMHSSIYGFENKVAPKLSAKKDPQHYIMILQYTPRNMHTVFALLCFVVVIHWLIFSYPSGLLHWHCGNLTIAPVPAKQPWWIWINTSCEFIMNDYITTTKQITTKPCAYFLGYTVPPWRDWSCRSKPLYKIFCRCKKEDIWHLESNHILQPPKYVIIIVNRYSCAYINTAHQ